MNPENVLGTFNPISLKSGGIFSVLIVTAGVVAGGTIFFYWGL